MAKTRRAGRKGKRGKKVVTRRGGRVQRGGQVNMTAQEALHNAQAALAQLASVLNMGGVGAPVAEATGVVEKVTVEAPLASTPQAESPATEAQATPTQTGGKTKKSSGKKRKLNGFMKFANTRRAALMKANPGAKIGEIGKMMGAEWRKMSDAAKQAFA